MIKKTIQRSEDLFVQFTPEELETLGVKEGDKFSWELQDESVVLRKYATLDINLSELSRNSLEMLIAESAEKDISINEVVEQILAKYVDSHNG